MTPSPDLHRKITNWHKATASGTGADCVEYGSTGELVAFRDTKQKYVPDDQRPILVFSPQAAASFISSLNAGAFPRPS